MRWPLALALVILMPAAEAATAVLTFSDTFGTATMDVEGTIEGNQASQLRGIMDFTGDRDGQVTQEEADRFLANGRSQLGEQAGAVLTEGNLTLDGNPLTGSELQALVLHGAPGPVQGGPPIRFEANMTFLFQPAQTDSHMLALEGRPTPGGPLRMTFHAPAGWQVQATLDGAVADAASIDMPTDGGKLVVAFTRNVEPSPALGPLAFLVVGLAAWVSRPATGPPH